MLKRSPPPPQQYARSKDQDAAENCEEPCAGAAGGRKGSAGGVANRYRYGTCIESQFVLLRQRSFFPFGYDFFGILRQYFDNTIDGLNIKLPVVCLNISSRQFGFTDLMIEVCRNNADNREPVAEGNYIKQLFILTHNAFFHREVTYNYVRKYEYVSFYLIRKRNNCSSVKLFREVDPKCPTQMRNVNPVKSSYAALWEEYHECQKPITLMNVTRKILEYYFLQLCGYDGAELRKAILVDGRPSFVDEFGNEDKEQFDLAQSMLAYISPERIGFNDGLHYVEESADPDVCKAIFKKIFEIMKQGQHYKMMYAVYD